MPTYDYRCDHCGHEFSKVRSFTEGALEKCPSCGQRPTRLFSPPAIVFKGSGWYKTDSRSTPSEGSSSSGASDTKKSDSSSKDKPTGSSGGSSSSGG
ncbi:MAG: FmdB family transcriptional regulator [Chloroflexota bacterium]|nr:FmdB family transcriptional regulator [Chloroflexota bacterium]MDE3194097.1 FmdB family transcriptional regulator [Chloroflexota bacterium]